jgi:hypothetical protein
MAREYRGQLKSGFCSYHVHAIMLPYTINGTAGILLVQSTPESSRVSNDNQRQYDTQGVVDNPHWLYWECWWFQGMAFMNLYGITDRRHQGRRLPEKLGALIDGVLMPAWRAEYCIIRQGYFLQSLRRLLREGMSAHNWAELTCGFSLYEYRALDLYIRILSAGMPPPQEEAWYLLNTEVAPHQRQFYQPTDWWEFKHLQSYGQRPVMNEWYLEITGQVMTPQAANRIGRVMGHLRPAGEALPPGISIPRMFAVVDEEELQVSTATSSRARIPRLLDRHRSNI